MKTEGFQGGGNGLGEGWNEEFRATTGFMQIKEQPRVHPQPCNQIAFSLSV